MKYKFCYRNVVFYMLRRLILYAVPGLLITVSFLLLLLFSGWHFKEHLEKNTMLPTFMDFKYLDCFVCFVSS